jgi:hypothetical protein
MRQRVIGLTLLGILRNSQIKDSEIPWLPFSFRKAEGMNLGQIERQKLLVMKC